VALDEVLACSDEEARLLAHASGSQAAAARLEAAAVKLLFASNPAKVRLKALTSMGNYNETMKPFMDETYTFISLSLSYSINKIESYRFSSQTAEHTRTH